MRRYGKAVNPSKNKKRGKKNNLNLGDGNVRSVVDLDTRRKVLPEKLLSNNVVHLTCESSARSGFCHVYIVGTCHVSEESCRVVRDVISYLKPEVGFLELCSSRASFLEPDDPLEPPPSLKKLAKHLISSIWEDTQDFFDILYTMLLLRTITDEELIRELVLCISDAAQDVYEILDSMETDMAANNLKVRHGNEFYVASEEIKKYGGKVILGDRPIEVTEERKWAKLPLWHKLKLMYGTVFNILFDSSAKDLNEEVEQLLCKDYETIAEDRKYLPGVAETIVDERDQYMSCLLHKVASKHSSVVAVVGKAHLRGIKKYWKQPIDMDKLLKMPPGKEEYFRKEIAASLGGHLYENNLRGQEEMR